MTGVILKNRKLNIEKLLSFGFEKTDGGYVYHADLVDGQMKLTVKIDAEMEREFVEGNERAKRLYEKMGFAIVAEKPNTIRLKDGTMQKEYFMVKYL